MKLLNKRQYSEWVKIILTVPFKNKTALENKCVYLDWNHGGNYP